MSDCTSTPTAKTSTCISNHITPQDLLRVIPSRLDSPPCRAPDSERACQFTPDEEEYVHEEGCSCDSSDLENSSDVDAGDYADKHPFGVCYDESCCDPAVMYHSSDEISYYRDKGMFFQDRGDGTGGDWYYTGHSVFVGKGTGVIFED